MKKSINLILALAFGIVLLAGAAVGQRANHLREAERFYRWVVSVSTQVRIFGADLIPDTAGEQQYQDEELFALLVEKSDPLLDDLPPSDADYDQSGVLLPKVVRYVAPPKPEDVEEDKDIGAIITEDQIIREDRLWRMAGSPEMAELREAYLEAASGKKLYSMGTSFGKSDLYSEETGVISIANMFFGFRKMAANLLWLEVDTFWHKGMIHRMVPLMNTTVMLDPTFIDAYLLGAWHLAYNQSARLDDTPWELRGYLKEYQAWAGPKEELYYSGITFLKDGIRKNPRNYRLYFDVGFAIYEEKLHDYINAERYMAEAIRLDHDRWVRRSLYRVQGVNGKFEESRAGWEEYLKRYPDNPVAPNFIDRMDGMIKERTANYLEAQAKCAAALAEKAAASGNAAEAAEWTQRSADLQAECGRVLDETFAHWDRMYKESERQADTFALGRAIRIKAKRLIEKEFYFEAIAELDRARFASNDFFWEGTDMMMDIKQKAGIPMELTELKKLRSDEAEDQYTVYLPKALEKQFYQFKTDRWVPESYRGQDFTELKDGSIELLKILFDNPGAALVLDELPGKVIFQAGDAWYLRTGSGIPEVPQHILDEMGIQPS
ncbi:MAG: hypothetical protein AMXMBFR84_12540 [Candidatus Hydrogenedentota bacterium]